MGGIIWDIKETKILLNTDYQKQDYIGYGIVCIVGAIIHLLTNIKIMGGKGIKVCEEWKHIEGFINFYNWAIKNGYEENLTLDRIDNNKDYCPSNCRWKTPKEQSNHRTNNVHYTFNGETKTSKQWCEIYNVSQTTLLDRLKRGWTLEQALTISTKGTHRKVNLRKSD